MAPRFSREVSLVGCAGDFPRPVLTIEIGLGVFVTYAGLNTAWSAFNGSFGQIMKQIGIVLLALVLGNLAGKSLRLQKAFNSLGQYAKERIAKARPTDPSRLSEGFVTCSLLFCAAPLAILGALQDGFTGDFKPLAIKSVMDGLATMAFARTFGWGVLSRASSSLHQGTISLAAQTSSRLRDQALLIP